MFRAVRSLKPWGFPALDATIAFIAVGCVRLDLFECIAVKRRSAGPYLRSASLMIALGLAI